MAACRAQSTTSDIGKSGRKRACAAVVLRDRPSQAKPNATDAVKCEGSESDPTIVQGCVFVAGRETEKQNAPHVLSGIRHG
jgi:hypothetical protein